MPLRIIRAGDNAALWDHCVETFLEGAADPGPSGHRDWIWLSHRNLRDRLLDTAQAEDHDGWLDPPISFFGDLAKLFDIREVPVGLLTRRRILARTANRLGRDILGRATRGTGGIVRSHVLDSLLADLLPEGIEPEAVRKALAALPGDGFTRLRDEWMVATYRAYLADLAKLGRPDWRSVNAILAERIEAGGLPGILRGAERLHVYGIASPRTRRRLLTALAGQKDVEVRLYLLHEPEPDPFFDGLTDDVEHIGAGAAGCGETSRHDIHVQPTPDAVREMAWVAREVKQLIASGAAEAHEIAVVARSGREDTRRAFRALTRAGVPASARIRTPLAEITALKALLLVFRGAAREWDYRSLRPVLDHPCFDTQVDLRGIDFIAGRRRVTGLDAWREKLELALGLVREQDRDTWGKGLFADRLEKDIDAFDRVRETLAPLSEPRTEGEWIDLTLALLKEDRGLFFLRRRLCDPVADRWDLVRLDQRGVVQLERLLREWRDLDPSEEGLGPADWYSLLRRLLEGNELILSTPAQKGVQILEAHDAGLVPFAHTFVVHANDGEFPLAHSSAAVMSDAERARLAGFGIPVDHREAALRRERSLWRAVTAQAGKVHVSYRTTSPSGTPLLPSLMVPEHDPSEQLPRLRRPTGHVSVSPEDADQEAAFALASELAAAPPSSPVASAPHAGVTPPAAGRVVVAPAHPELLRQAIVAAVAESHRGPGLARAAGPDRHPALRPNPWNGELRDPEVLRWLRERFDDTYPWSASQLESYARVPFQFLLERVLRITALEEAEEETSPLTFGGVAHEILEKFYGAYCDELPAGLSAEGPAELPNKLADACLERFEEVAERVLRAQEQSGDWLGLPPLWAVTRETIHEAVREYIAWELPFLHKKRERPFRVEHEFGRDGDSAPLRGHDIHGRPASLRLRGKIDRIDRTGTADAPVLHVLDYKSSTRPSSSGYEDGTVLQGTLYLEALAAEGHTVKHCRYRIVKKPGRPQNGAQIARGSEPYKASLAFAFSIPDRVRAGLFEPVASRVGGWESWDIPLEIRRMDARLEEGHRFETTRPGLEPQPERPSYGSSADLGPAAMPAGGEGR